MTRKMAFALCSVLFVSVLSPSARSQDASSKLAWQMFRSVGTPSEDLFISPASLTIAVALAFEASNGPTRELARNFLKLPLPRDPMAPLRPAVLSSFKPEDNSIKLDVQNAIWVDPKGFFPRADFKDQAQKAYGAKIEIRTFGDGQALSNEINAWVKQATHSMIDELVTPSDLEGNEIAILNAVYFLGTWAEPFDGQFTKAAEFKLESGKVKKVQLMNKSERFDYAETKSYQLVHLPYKNKNYVMSILLPKKGKKLSTLETTLKGTEFSDTGVSKKVSVQLPRFKIDWGAKNIASQLKAIGMPTEIPAEDFQNFGAKKRVLLTAVVHRAVVTVNEEGTEAAAATAMLMRAGAAPEKPIEFIVDHPFLFAIRDIKRNEILFLGRYSGIKP